MTWNSLEKGEDGWIEVPREDAGQRNQWKTDLSELLGRLGSEGLDIYCWKVKPCDCDRILLLIEHTVITIFSLIKRHERQWVERRAGVEEQLALPPLLHLLISIFLWSWPFLNSPFIPVICNNRLGVFSSGSFISATLPSSHVLYQMHERVFVCMFINALAYV